jgi:hypothetical protein
VSGLGRGSAWRKIAHGSLKGVAGGVGFRPAFGVFCLAMTANPPAAIPQVPVSWGELIDKITILEIKTGRLPTAEARANAMTELNLLQAIAAPALGHAQIGMLAIQLKALNERLWGIEDRIRACERAGDFGAAFVELARSVYKHNDERGAIKRQINLALGSGLIEEKSYQPY